MELTKHEAAFSVRPELATVAGIHKLCNKRLETESSARLLLQDGQLPPPDRIRLCEDHKQWIHDGRPADSMFSLASTSQDAPLDILRDRALMPMCLQCTERRMKHLELPGDQPIGHIDTCVCASSIVISECAYCTILIQAAMKANYIEVHTKYISPYDKGFTCVCYNIDFGFVNRTGYQPRTPEVLRFCACCYGLVSVPAHALDGTTHLASPFMGPSYAVERGSGPAQLLLDNKVMCDKHPVELFGDRTKRQIEQAGRQRKLSIPRADDEEKNRQDSSVTSEVSIEAANLLKRERSASSTGVLQDNADQQLSITDIEPPQPEMERHAQADTPLSQYVAPTDVSQRTHIRRPSSMASVLSAGGAHQPVLQLPTAAPTPSDHQRLGSVGSDYGTTNSMRQRASMPPPQTRPHSRTGPMMQDQAPHMHYRSQSLNSMSPAHSAQQVRYNTSPVDQPHAMRPHMQLQSPTMSPPVPVPTAPLLPPPHQLYSLSMPQPQVNAYTQGTQSFSQQRLPQANAFANQTPMAALEAINSYRQTPIAQLPHGGGMPVFDPRRGFYFPPHPNQQYASTAANAKNVVNHFHQQDQPEAMQFGYENGGQQDPSMQESMENEMQGPGPDLVESGS